MTTLRLSFPGSIDQAQVATALRALVATIGRPQRLFSPSRFVGLEVWATNTGITHLVTTPDADAARTSLLAALPGVRLESATRPASQLTGSAFGLQISGPAHGLLRIDISPEATTSLLASLTGFREGETVVLQWLAAPMAKNWAPFSKATEADRTQKLKSAEAEIVASGRIAVWSSDHRRSAEIAYRAARVLRIVSGPEGQLRTRRRSQVPRLVSQVRPPAWVWPSHLNIAEWAGLVGWPSTDIPIQGLARGLSRLLPLPIAAPSDGPVVGVTTFPGPARDIRLGTTGRLRHLHVIGPTGVGKTTLLTHIIEGDIHDGRGVVVFDPLGDLTSQVCERIPDSRQDDVVVVDPTDAASPVGFNVIDSTDPHRMADFLVGVMARLFSSSWGPRTADVLRSSLLTLSASGNSTLADIPDLLTDQAFRRRHLPSVMNDRVLAGFWTWFEGISEAERSSVIAPLLNKVRAVVLRPEAVRALCHREGQLNLAEVFTKRRIVIIRLAKGLLGEDTAGLIGGLMLARLWHEILGRAAVSADRRAPAFIYLDEFQDYLRLPVGMGDMLSQARGMGVGLVVAHQHLGQLPDPVRRDVMSNVGSRIIFQTTADDSRILARDLEPHLTPHDLRGLAAREIIARVALADRVLPPVTGRTLPPSRPSAHAEAIRSRSRSRYGRPMVDPVVETQHDPAIGRRARGGQR